MKTLIVCLMLTAAAIAQTGSSIAFSTPTTAGPCITPTSGTTILCGTGSSVLVSFNGAAYVTLPATGPVGPAGATGPAGPIGPAGPQGATGAAGASGSIQATITCTGETITPTGGIVLTGCH